MILAASPPSVTMPLMRMVVGSCWRRRPMATWAMVMASAALMPCSGAARACRHGRHEIMPAGMSYFGQSIVLGADGKMERTVACSRAKGGWQIANPCLNLKTGIGEDLGDPAAGLLFGKTQFRVVVNAMREIDQGLLIGVYNFLSLLLCVHECFLSRFVIDQQPRSVRRRE